MSLAGDLSEYSLAEIFNFVQEGNKTGVLSIEPTCEAIDRSLCSSYDLVFQGGRVMSVATGNRSDRQSLLQTIEQRQWLTPTQFAELAIQVRSLRQPLGNHLKSLSLINTEQLIFIFNSQVIANLCKMFVEVHHGRFKFDSRSPLAYGEMTGLSLTAKQATLMGLRLLRDWRDLTPKLPAAESTLQKLVAEPVGVSLERQELEVWKLAVGEMSIVKIAKNLGLETSRVQQIGFRLSVIGLVREVVSTAPPLAGAVSTRLPQSSVLKPSLGSHSTAPASVSTSFLSNLMGFLKKKV